MLMQKAYQDELHCWELLLWEETFSSVWAESGLLKDGRGKYCSEKLFHCCSCLGSYLAQIKIARELFLLPLTSCSLQQLPKIPKLVTLSEYSVCFSVAPALLFQWNRECRKICFPMPGNFSCCFRTIFLLLLSSSSVVSLLGFFFFLLCIWIFSPFPLVARRCSDIADHTSSLQKDPSQTTCRAVSGRSLGFVVYKALLFPL